MVAADVTIRPPEPADLEPIAAMLFACETHDLPDPESLESVLIDLRNEWRRAGLDLRQDGWVAVGTPGTVLGYAHLVLVADDTAFVASTSGVHPAHRGLGIGGALLDRAEVRARELVGGEGRIRAVVSGDGPTTRALFSGRGYRIAEQSWRMEIDLEEEPVSPEWPSGMTVRRYEPGGGDDRLLFELMRDAFSDNDGYDWTASFEEWTSFMLLDDSPANHFLVESDDGLIAAALCPWYPTPDGGWIRQFAVRRDQRRQGLGRALLGHVFRELYLVGQRRVGLGVDSWNTTGARQLYESCGMRETLRHDKYEKSVGETAGFPHEPPSHR